MKIREKIFVNIVSNVIIVVIVVTIFVFAFSEGATNAFTQQGAIYNGDKSSNKISLMFNVYEGNDQILEILEILEQNSIKCTFFVGGSWVKNNPEIFIKIVARGHEIANHGYNHKNHSGLSDAEDISEIMSTHTLISSLCGIEMNLFAPPSGDYDKRNVINANSLGYVTVMWSKDTIDWRDQNADLIFSRATSGLSGGDLILMHPTQSTVEALQRIIDYCRQNNFIIVTVGENINY
ncbi:MAG TPA: polysaccharide deacetylase family protein [Clostridia bacterium]|nr:polysaccharide deacetylase family protein [Clostridia bacterium]